MSGADFCRLRYFYVWEITELSDYCLLKRKIIDLLIYSIKYNLRKKMDIELFKQIEYCTKKEQK